MLRDVKSGNLIDESEIPPVIAISTQQPSQPLPPLQTQPPTQPKTPPTQPKTPLTQPKTPPTQPKTPPPQPKTPPSQPKTPPSQIPRSQSGTLSSFIFTNYAAFKPVRSFQEMPECNHPQATVQKTCNNTAASREICTDT